MKIYVDEQKKYEDTKATGQCFTLVGALGIIAIILIDTGIIKLSMIDSANKIMMSVVMGLVFLIFFIIGIKSFAELKSISKKARENDTLESQITEYVLENYHAQLENMAVSSGETSGDLYYKRADAIAGFITEKYADIKEDFLDHMVEKIYSEIFSDIIEQ